MIYDADQNLQLSREQQVIKVLLNDSDVTMICTSFSVAGGWVELYDEKASQEQNHIVKVKSRGKVAVFRRGQVPSN